MASHAGAAQALRLIAASFRAHESIAASLEKLVYYVVEKMPLAKA
jgi:hypothetical protein